MEPDKAIKERGFEQISTFSYGITSSIYWHPERHFELQFTELDSDLLLKGIKRYYIKGVSEEGRETWDRNIGKLMDRIRNSFPEYHLYATGVSRVPDELIPDKKKLKKEQKDTIERRIDYLQQVEEQTDEDLGLKAELHFPEGKSKELSERDKNYVGSIITQGGRDPFPSLKVAHRRAKKGKEKLKEKLKRVQKSVSEAKDFESQFKQKGSANCFLMACSTPLMAFAEEGFEAGIEEVMEDVKNKHTFGGFTQSVKKGLKVQIEELLVPWVSHQAEFAGLFPPDQASKYPQLADQIKDYFWTTVGEDITVKGRTKKEGKSTPARVMKTFLDRVETISEESAFEKMAEKEIPKKGGWLGNLMKGGEPTEVPFLFNLDKLNHGYLSGTTGSGKTYTARVLVENALVKGANVVVLDTTRQWTGLVRPASRVEERFDRLGVDKDLTTGFPVDIYTPNSEAGKELPPALSSLSEGVSVVTLKGLYDTERCKLARDILAEIHMTMGEEFEGLKTLVVIEEAHTFLPGNVDQSAKDMAKECAKRIERISREARKYGLNLLLLSQSLSDFRRSSKTVREMMNSKFFMRATDRSEIGYVEDYVSKEAADWVKNLDVSEVLVSSAGVGPAKVYVRPPFSQVGELSDSEIEEVTRREEAGGHRKEEFLKKVATFKAARSGQPQELGEKERALLEIAERYLDGEDEPIHISEAQKKLEIKNRKEIQELVDKMEEKGLIETKKLKKRGSPRGIVPQ